MHPYVLLRDQLPKSKGQKSQAFSFWIFTPGIALESWKILSGNFLFLELKNPGKFCPGRKLSWNFLKIIYIFPGIYSSGIFHSWNFPLLEFCPGTFCSWNLISRNFLVDRSSFWWHICGLFLPSAYVLESHATYVRKTDGTKMLFCN